MSDNATLAAGSSAPACSAWTVDFNGPWGPERCEYKSTRPITEQAVRDRFVMDRPLCGIVRITPNKVITDTAPNLKDASA